MDKAAQREWEEYWGDNPLPPFRFGFEVNTLCDLSAMATAVEAWLDDARQALIEPVIEATASDRAHDYNRRASVGVPGKVSADVVAWTAGARGPRISDYTDKAWSRAMNMVRQGKMGQVALTVSRVGLDKFPDSDREQVEVAIDGVHRDFSTAAWRIRAHATVGTFGGVVPQTVQAAYVSLAKDAMTRFDGCWGGVFLERQVHEFAFETATFRASVGFGLKLCDEFARGYVWGNLHGPTQVAKLGGLPG